MPRHQREKVSRLNWIGAVVAALFGIFVPLQMVSQTWDDHDRSGRYAARDFGMNYLSSLEPGAVIFTNGDNDTFPSGTHKEVGDTAQMCVWSICRISPPIGMSTSCVIRRTTLRHTHDGNPRCICT